MHRPIRLVSAEALAGLRDTASSSLPHHHGFVLRAMQMQRAFKPLLPTLEQIVCELITAPRCAIHEVNERFLSTIRLKTFYRIGAQILAKDSLRLKRDMPVTSLVPSIQQLLLGIPGNVLAGHRKTLSTSMS
jgi:hypothetical protein